MSNGTAAMGKMNNKKCTYVAEGAAITVII